jgi:ferritin-like metal-binding protein YciE
VALLLDESLEEEKEEDQKLNKIALSEINQAAWEASDLACS